MKGHKTKIVECAEGRSPLTGKVLVATPSFKSSLGKALIYVVEHDSRNGAVGLNVNHPFGSIRLGEFLTQDHRREINQDIQDTRLQVFFGGPLEPDKITVLSLNEHQEDSFDEHCKLSLYGNPGDYLHNLITSQLEEKFMLTKGIYLWDKGQLESEIDNNVWIIADPTVPMIFGDYIKDRWMFALSDALGRTDISSMVSYCGHA